MLNLSVLLEDSARRYPSKDALVLGNTKLTYAQVDGAANQVANLLVERGVQPGDKVALSSPNLPWFPIVYYGVLKAGCVVVPLNILLKRREVAYHLTDADAVAFFCFEGTEELPIGMVGYAGFQESTTANFFLITADPAASSPIDGVETLGQALSGRSDVFESVPTEATDTATILYTSGTTGQPKGAELSHANTLLNALTCNRLFDNKTTDTHIVALPLFHTFGATVQMHAGFSTGATLHLIPRFDASQVIDLFQREDITFFAGVPTMWWGLLESLTDDVDVERIARNLRIGLSGGASLPADIISRVQDKFGVQILEGYGLSETSPLATFNDPDRGSRPGSIGLPVWGVEVKLIDDEWNEIAAIGEVGEIAVKGHNIMKGYYGRPAATAEAIRGGWFRTGDLARKDDDGFYFIVDRSKDMIIRGGFNVYSREVEEVLMTHPGISLATVIGVPHERHGEEIKAFVIPNAGATLTGDELIDWSREQMAAYKYPRIIDIVDSLPTTATGKILKRELT
ncbi:long-chain-fatty-acid--CoA ligase [Rhodococcus opacus]|uniref:long-chain-fatty-acid--CoA ligase n=1 Tax=Rhodococcus TaxID=1827 RepID=UPI001422787B|nr:long-chain fatty acid--CoA ligase [Rhodococcus opacus]NHU41737.1 long-chain fatty acid--CoA ligase [Rhodococcus sp. A14]UNN01130.1 long-chain fatty acid--CoA ligase [Rhodococcus opacus]WKN53291.1 long-chain fatty acid--CoA ligase [Rhodococcus opacus]